MFTGIVKEIGVLKKKSAKGKKGALLEIACKKIRPHLGDSIAVNGVCLTVIKKTKSGFCADVVPETLKRTNLGKLTPKTKINLEPSMRPSDLVDGHFVLGHVDKACKILQKGKIEHGEGLVIKLPKSLAPYIAEKGSVTLNGVSLTVAKVHEKTFSVALIPYTTKNTNLGYLKIGDIVNVEIDILARYLYNFNKSK